MTREAIVALDVGTSSVRTLLFDSEGHQRKDFGQQLRYDITATPDGGVEVDPDMLARLCEQSIDKLHQQMQNAGEKPKAVGFDTFWHSFLGVDANGRPVTPIMHLFDTRSTAEADELATVLDPAATHARTGCRLHPSYWPAKLLWLSRHRASAFKSAARWMSFGEYFFLRLFDQAAASVSMVSGSGLWNQAANDYDDEVLRALPIRREQLWPANEMDHEQTALREPYKTRWPLFDGIPWYPALGDGACNNIGSGCAARDAFSLMVGTSGAMRAVIEADHVSVPDGLWCYRVDRRRYVLGGATSNGGDVYAWMRRTLALPQQPECESALTACHPGSHGLLLLPFFAGERSPYWRADLRAAITGLSLAAKPIDILQAALESVALRFREIYALMVESLGPPKRVIASGGALLASPAWTQMMADALEASITPCLEPEATGRGAALLAAERLGILKNVTDPSVELGQAHAPQPGSAQAYETLLADQKKLFNKLFVEK